MQITDKVYGSSRITEQIFLDLINHPAMQRLERVSQFGLPDELYCFKGFSRLEHSIGVMILLKQVQASQEEQVAGLLHDVSHTVFSHLIDHVIGDPKKEDYQDENMKKIIKKSGLAKILKDYGYEWEKIANHHNYPLLEQQIPKLCADRFDYAIREFHMWSNPEAVKTCIKNLTIYDKKLAFKSKKQQKNLQ